jgi:hypothetical protein
VQGDSPARSCDGDLRESAAQAATGLGHGNRALPASKTQKKCDCRFGDECRWIHPRLEAEAPVIGSLDLVKGSQGRITPDTSATSTRPSLSKGASHAADVDQTKGNTA